MWFRNTANYIGRVLPNKTLTNSNCFLGAKCDSEHVSCPVFDGYLTSFFELCEAGRNHGRTVSEFSFHIATLNSHSQSATKIQLLIPPFRFKLQQTTFPLSLHLFLLLIPPLAAV